jgi:hypothetical protein
MRIQPVVVILAVVGVLATTGLVASQVLGRAGPMGMPVQPGTATFPHRDGKWVDTTGWPGIRSTRGSYSPRSTMEITCT